MTTSLTQYTSTILITGASTGLGYSLALTLAKSHPTILILITSRSTTTPNPTQTTLHALTNQTNILHLPLDLSSKSSIRSFAITYTSHTPPYPEINTLYLNAGIQYPSSTLVYTSDNIEATFGVNHVGHALLFYLLTPHLSANARIVITASGTHDPAQKTMVPDAKYTSAVELAYPDPESQRVNNGRQRYATSKLCNVLWMYALSRRVEELNKRSGRKWSVVAFDPGLMPGTGLARGATGIEKVLWYQVLPRMIPVIRVLVGNGNVHRVQESAASLAAVGEERRDEEGVYFEGRRVIKTSRESYELGKQEDLWRWTVDFVGEGKEERKRWEELDV